MTVNPFGIEHVAKRDYTRARDRYVKLERRANRVENAGNTVAGAAGATLGLAALRDAAIKDYPNVETKLARAGAKVGPRTAATLTHGKPGLKVLGAAVGGGAVGLLGARARKSSHKRAVRYETMSKSLEPGSLMHQADIAKAFSVNRAGEATRILKPKRVANRKVFRVNSSGETLPTRVTVRGQGPQRKPFLHPDARPMKSPPETLMRMSERLSSDKKPTDQLRAVRAVGGPKAPKKVLDALSGKDYGDTMSRLGRATRRQNKEFSAQVHPLSGRVIDMRRGGAVSTIHGGHLPRRSQKRLAEITETGSTQAVRDRAGKTLMRANPATKGPTPVAVHTHPTFGEGKGAHTRHYPSGADVEAAAQQRDAAHAVITHQPGPRGSKKTKVVTTRAVKDHTAWTLPSLAAHDNKTVTPGLIAHTSRGDKQLANFLAESRKASRGNSKRVVSYDTYLKRKTATPKAAKKSGFHTREQLYKSEAGSVMHRADLAKAINTDAGLRRHKKAQAVVGGTAATLGLGALGAKTGSKLLPKTLKFGKTPRGEAWAKHLDHTANALVFGAAGLGGASGLHQSAIYRAESKKRKPV